MKNAKMFLIAGCLIAAMASRISSAASTATIISKDVLTEGSYCHMKFPAIDEDSLSSKHPFLKSSDEGDIIDFYGPCNYDPLGKDAIHAQLLELQHRRARDYMD